VLSQLLGAYRLGHFDSSLNYFLIQSTKMLDLVKV
jgi:hypothetical protein